MSVFRHLLVKNRNKSEQDSNVVDHLRLLLHDQQFGAWTINLDSDLYCADAGWHALVNREPSAEEASIDWWEDRIHPHDRRNVRKALKAVINNETDLYECEYRVLTDADEFIWVLDRGRVKQRNKANKVTLLCGITLNVNEKVTAEQNVNRKDYVLRTLYSILSSENQSFADQVQQILQLGCDYLQMRCGIVSYVEGDRYTVLHVFTNSEDLKIQAGDVFDLGITYCKFTLEQRQPVGFAHAAKTEVVNHPSYEALKLEAYLGAPLFLNNRTFGTLNFTSIEPRAEEFTHSEKYCIQLMAEWVSNQLQNQFIEKRRLETHKKLAMHLQHSPLATIEWTSNYRVKRWSQKATAMLGWAEAQVINKSPREWPIINKEDQKHLNYLADQLEACQQEEYAFECNLVKLDGELISTEWFVSHSELHNKEHVLIQTLVLDISKRVQAENNRIISNARYVDLYQNAPDMYFSLDGAGNIMSANNVCHQLLGYEDGELINIPFWNLIQKQDVRRVRRHIDVAFKGEVEEFEMEVNILTKTSSVLKMHQRIRIIEPRKGLPHELRILARDITERSEIHQSKLLHLQQQRDEIGREVQHRIKNSLQAVVGLLKVNLDTYPELKNVLTVAIGQVDTIAIVNNLMMDSGRTNINLLRLIKMLINTSSSLFRIEIQMTNALYLGKVYEICEAEAIAVSLIISELMINALKHHASNKLGDDNVSVALYETGDTQVSIQITNTIANNSESQDQDKSNVGISMMEALMPPQGAKLDQNKTDNFYEVSLVLSKPVISEVENVKIIANDKFAAE